MNTDVVVIGGGPAGLAAAIAARSKGFEVTVIEAARPPIDKACGEAVLPSGVAMLRRLGVKIADHDGFALRGIRFLANGTSVDAMFDAGVGLAMRRTRLHSILAAHASAVGVRLLWGTRVGDASELSSCRWIVGADGQNSRVRRAAGLEVASRHSPRFGFRRHYRISPWTDFVEVYWGPRCQIYVTPVSQDEIGIALLSDDSRLRLDSALRDFPELQSRLVGSEPSSAERGAPTVSRRLGRVFRGHTVLIGDASGSVDAISGVGLSLAFHQAIALSEALCTGDLTSYEIEHRRLARLPTFTTRLLLLLARFPLLRQATIEMLALRPPIFKKLLTRHAGSDMRRQPDSHASGAC